MKLKFTPLEFETVCRQIRERLKTLVKIYSVGVWNLSIQRIVGAPLC